MSLTRRLSHIRGETGDLLSDLVKARDGEACTVSNNWRIVPNATKAQYRGAARDLEKALVLLDRAKAKLLCNS